MIFVVLKEIHSSSGKLKKGQACLKAFFQTFDRRGKGRSFSHFALNSVKSSFDFSLEPVLELQARE
jgi:hypothetical protein